MGRSKLVQADLLHDWVGVLGRGGCRHWDTESFDVEDKAQRVVECLKLAGRYQPTQMFLLNRCVPLRLGLDVGDAEVLERRARASQSRPPRDYLLVDILGERVVRVARMVANVGPFGIHQLAERITPRLVVRRVHENAVYIEDRALKAHAVAPPFAPE